MTGRAAEETAFDELATEARDPQAADLDLQSTAELVALMNEADEGVPAAVARAGDAIAAAIDAVAARLASGGRLVYVGAGRRDGSPSSTPPNASPRSPSRPGASSP